MCACWIQHWHNIAPDEEDHHDNHDQDDNDDEDDDGDDHHDDDDHRDQPDDDHHYDQDVHDNQDQGSPKKMNNNNRVYKCQSVPMSLLKCPSWLYGMFFCDTNVDWNAK